MTLRSVYLLDKETYKFSIELMQNGFAFDTERAAEYQTKLRSLENEAVAKLEAVVKRPLRRTEKGISMADLHQAAFKELKIPVLFRSTKSKKPSLDVNAMRAYCGSARDEVRAFALAELERKRAQKLRSTYIDKTLERLIEGRDYVGWKSFGTVSGRWSSRLQQLPRKTNDPTVEWSYNEGKKEYAGGGIRSLYIAPPGRKIVSFDAAQIEMRIAAYISGDPVMIAACEQKDLHAANAELVWGDEFRLGDKTRKYTLRQLAKNFGFAVAYLAEAGTVYANILANGEKADMAVIEAAIRMLRSKFRVYFRWQEKRLFDIMRTGYAYTPLWGRPRWLSHTPRPTEAANYHVQSGAAEVVNSKMVALSKLVKARNIDALFVACVHDSVSAEVADAEVDAYLECAKEVWAQPVEFSSSGQTHVGVFPADYSVGERWS